MAGERTADDIQRDIEQARTSLGAAVDQLAARTNPKHVADNVKQSLRQKLQTPQGKAIAGVGGALLALLVIRKITKH